MSMGQKRAIIDDEFKDEDELDTPKDIKHDKDSKRYRKPFKQKGKKVQIWVKKETLEYEKELTKLQIELLKFQNHVKDKY